MQQITECAKKLIKYVEKCRNMSIIRFIDGLGNRIRRENRQRNCLYSHHTFSVKCGYLIPHKCNHSIK